MKYDQSIKKIFKDLNLDLTTRCNEIETNLKIILPTHKKQILDYLKSNTNINNQELLYVDFQIEELINCYLNNITLLNEFFKFIYTVLLTKGSDITITKYNRCNNIVEFLINIIKPENIIMIHDKLDFVTCYNKVVNIISNIDGINIDDFNKNIISSCIKDLENITNFYNFYPEMLFDIRGDVISSIVTSEILEVDTTNQEDISKLCLYIDQVLLLNETANNPFKQEDHIVAIYILSKTQLLLLKSLTESSIDDKIYKTYNDKINKFINTKVPEDKPHKHILISNNIIS